MDMKTIAMHMWMYWVLGLFMMLMTYRSGNKDLLRIETPAVGRWLRILGMVTLFRVVMLKFLSHQPQVDSQLHAVLQIPAAATLTVFWEDMAHGLPLVLLQRLIGTKWFTIPVHILAFALIMLAFGSGHLYQGIGPAAMLMLYIPFSVKMGKKFGFGTVMLCHTLYDLITILTLQFIVRGM